MVCNTLYGRFGLLACILIDTCKKLKGSKNEKYITAFVSVGYIRVSRRL